MARRTKLTPKVRGANATTIACMLVWLPTACAKPCFDDGLAQGGCPTQDTDTDDAGTDDNGTMDGTAGGEATMGADATATDTADDTAGSGGFGGECPDFSEILLPQVPTFQLVIDRSGSMNDDFGGSSRWDATKQTLIDPADGIVSELQSQIRFGVTLYSNPNGNQCPDIEALAPQLDAADEITTLLDGTMPDGDTPTGESIEIITADLLADDWEGEKIIVLTTDGEPDTCEEPEPMSDREVAAARGAAVDAVTNAYDQGIRTFVISVGDDVGEDHLQDIANAGQGVADGDPDATFYVANNTDALVAAFQEIIAGVRACNFDLGEPLTPEQAPGCEVTVNESPVPYDDPNGWALDGEMQIELQGDACTQIQDGVVVVELNCGCQE